MEVKNHYNKKKNTVSISVSISTSLMFTIDQLIARTNLFTSRSEFICKAIEKYVKDEIKEYDIMKEKHPELFIDGYKKPEIKFYDVPKSGIITPQTLIENNVSSKCAICNRIMTNIFKNRVSKGFEYKYLSSKYCFIKNGKFTLMHLKCKRTYLEEIGNYENHENRDSILSVNQEISNAV